MEGKFVVKAYRYNLGKWIPVLVTMALGLCHMLPISETIKNGVSAVYLFTLLFLSPGMSAKHLMFVLSANELLDIGTTSLTMIFVALFTAVHCFRYAKNMKYSASIFVCGLALVIFGFYVYIVYGMKDQLIYTIKHLFFLYYTAIVLTENRDQWCKLYVDSFRYIACGAIYFTILYIALNGIPSLTERFTPSDEITINFLGIVCALSIVNILYGIIALNADKKIGIILMIGAGVSGMLTQSRTFILAVGIGVVMLVLLTSSMYKKIIYIYLGIALASLFVLLYIMMPAISERIDVVLLRIFEPSSGDISNGRYGLWTDTIDVMLSDTDFLWVGAGDYGNIGALDRGRVTVAHNMFLETWVIYGIIGCTILFFLYVSFIRKYVFFKKIKEVKLISFVPLLVMLCCLFYSHHFIGRSLSMVFALSFLPMVLESNVVRGK